MKIKLRIPFFLLISSLFPAQILATGANDLKTAYSSKIEVIQTNKDS